MSEDHLLERLIDEAARRGRTECDRDRAIKTAEEVAAALTAARFASKLLTDKVSKLEKQSDEAGPKLEALYTASERLMIEVEHPSKRNHKDRLKEAALAVRIARIDAAFYCGDIPF